MRQQTSPYGFGTTVALPFDQAVARTREALSREGFGVLTEIDVASTFKAKLNVDFPPYVILGACNPPLAHQVLSAELQMGLLLPCNVIVYAAEEEGRSVVAAMDPSAALGLTANERVREIAREVKARLERVIDDIAATSTSTGAR